MKTKHTPKLLFGLISIIIIFSFSCSNPISDHEATVKKTFWLNNPELKEEAEQAMEKARLNLHNIKDVRNLMKRFYEVEELSYCQPDILMVFAKNLRGNCMMAAVLGEWALEHIDIPARIVILVNTKENKSHAIAISNNNKIFISNKYVMTIAVPEWRKYILERFHSHYDLLKEGE